MSDSVRPHRRQPIRLPLPWDSPCKSPGVGCHCLLHCMKVKSESEVAQSCPTLSDLIYCSRPGSSIHGIFQARILGVECQCLLRVYSIYIHTHTHTHTHTYICVYINIYVCIQIYTHTYICRCIVYIRYTLESKEVKI